MREVHIGKTYKHFKGHEYLVLCIGINTETNEKMVVYQDIQNASRIYIRPYDMFISEVDHKKYPDIKQEYRFEEN